MIIQNATPTYPHMIHTIGLKQLVNTRIDSQQNTINIT